MSQKVVSVMWSVAAAGLAAVLVSGTVSAESRADVLERIRPVGQVAVEGQPVAAAPATPAAAEAPAAPAAETAVPAAETAVAAPASAPAAALAAAPGGGDGAALYIAKGCVACHGADAKSPVMSTYPKLAGLAAPYVVTQMKDIKSGARNNGQSMVMKGIMASVSDEEIQAIADWLGTL